MTAESASGQQTRAPTAAQQAADDMVPPATPIPAIALAPVSSQSVQPRHPFETLVLVEGARASLADLQSRYRSVLKEAKTAEVGSQKLKERIMALEQERDYWSEQAQTTQKNLDHVKKVLAMQQRLLEVALGRKT
jgi:hypothetical protein